MKTGTAKPRERLPDAVTTGVFAVPGDGSLDFEAIVTAPADKRSEGRIVVEAGRGPKAHAPLEMARVGRRELMRVIGAAGCEGMQ